MPDAPVGQAVEMDAQTGRSSETLPGFGPPGNRIRASDDDVQGMVGLQQQRQDTLERVRSPTSLYSQQEYVFYPFSPSLADLVFQIRATKTSMGSKELSKQRC